MEVNSAELCLLLELFDAPNFLSLLGKHTTPLKATLTKQEICAWKTLLFDFFSYYPPMNHSWFNKPIKEGKTFASALNPFRSKEESTERPPSTNPLQSTNRHLFISLATNNKSAARAELLSLRVGPTLWRTTNYGWCSNVLLTKNGSAALLLSYSPNDLGTFWKVFLCWERCLMPLSAWCWGLEIFRFDMGVEHQVSLGWYWGTLGPVIGKFWSVARSLQCLCCRSSGS